MGEDIPRRLRRFSRSKDASAALPSAQTSNDSSENLMSEESSSRISSDKPAPQVRYWDQKDPSLDELTTSLFNQIEPEVEQETGVPVQKAPAHVHIGGTQTSSKNQSELQKTQSEGQKSSATGIPPLIKEKENFLEMRRRRRETAIPTLPTKQVSADSSNSKENLDVPVSDSNSKPVSSAGNSDPESGMDVKDLFGNDSISPESKTKLDSDLAELQKRLAKDAGLDGSAPNLDLKENLKDLEFKELDLSSAKKNSTAKKEKKKSA